MCHLVCPQVAGKCFRQHVTGLYDDENYNSEAGGSLNARLFGV